MGCTGPLRWWLGLQYAQHHSADGVVVGLAGEHAVIHFLIVVAVAGELELALAGRRLGGMSGGPGALIEVIALDVDLPNTAAVGLADQEAVVGSKFAHRFKIFDGIDTMGAYREHFKEKAGGLARVGRPGGVELAEKGAFLIALLLIAGGGVGGDQGGMNLPALGIELVSAFGKLHGERCFINLESSGRSKLRSGGVLRIGLESLLEVGKGLARLIRLESGEARCEC